MKILALSSAFLAVFAGTCSNQPEPPQPPKPQTGLLAFYSGTGVDNLGRKLEQYWQFSDDQFNDPKTYVGWMFPLKLNAFVIAGQSNPAALKTEEQKTFGTSATVQDNFRKSANAIAKFYGVEIQTATKSQCTFSTAQISTRFPIWVNNPTHNETVMPRVYNSLWSFGQRDLANCFYKAMIVAYWQNATHSKQASGKYPDYLTQYQSKGLKFYLGQQGNNENKKIDEIHKFDNDTLEENHNFIQWIFQNNKPSGPNPVAPIVTPLDAMIFQNSQTLAADLPQLAPIAANIDQSIKTMFSFYGFSAAIAAGTCTATDNADIDERRSNFLTNTHNFLRVTRMEESLDLMGRGRLEGACLYAKLKEWWDGYKPQIGKTSFDFWTEAYDYAQTNIVAN